MYWTTKTPTEIGWYWVKNPKNKYERGIVKVMKHITLHHDGPDGEYMCVYDETSGDCWIPEEYDYEWAGPIEEPKEE